MAASSSWACPKEKWRLLTTSAKLRANQWVEVTRHDFENLKLRLVPPVILRGKTVVEGSKDPLPRSIPVPLSMRGGRTNRDDELAPGLGVPALPDALGEFSVDAQPGFYRFAGMLQPPPPPYYLEAVRIGAADLMMQDVEVTADTAVTVVYRTDGGSVIGTAENCVSGGVLLVPADPAQRGHGLSRSGPCDAVGHYEVRAVRPGDYLALALAGNSVLPVFNEVLLNQGVKVTVRPNEATSVDLKAVTKPVY